VSRALAAAFAVVVAVTPVGAAGGAPPLPDFAGAWTLNRELSDLPKEAGFDPDYQEAGSAASGRSGGSSSGGGGRGGRGGGGASSGTSARGGSGAIATHFESPEDSQKIKELVAEVTHPPAALTVTQSATEITFADGDGRTRTYRINGKEETVQLQAGPIGVVTKWEAAQLLIRYLVEKNRELRVTVSRAASGRRLLMTAQFAEKGRGEIIKRVYD
jgi:hypothetical protein